MAKIILSTSWISDIFKISITQSFLQPFPQSRPHKYPYNPESQKGISCSVEMYKEHILFFRMGCGLSIPWIMKFLIILWKAAPL